MMRDDKGRPQSLFKTLRRMHGHHIDAGLNDLTEAFANFMTRARYFSIGHLRRTWSHSAVEFMKYRRRLPALVGGSDDDDVDFDKMGLEREFSRCSDGDAADDGDGPETSDLKKPTNLAVIKSRSADPRRVYVANVPSRVTLKQLASFFSKFGRVATCTIPVEKASATMPRRTRGYAFVNFRNADDAENARRAPPSELTLYDRVMVVTPCTSTTFSKSKLSFEDDETSLASETSTGEESSAAASGAISLDALPNKILSKIVRYLPISDRIRVERVCKRWQEVAFESWTYEKSLSFRQEFPSSRARPSFSNALKSIMHRCGRYVQSLDLAGGASLFLNDQSLVAIAEQCSSLKEINISGLKVRWQSLKVFAEICGPKLESIIYRDAFLQSERGFWWLFRFSPNLKKVDIGEARRLTGHCFRLLSFPLDEVLADGCTRLDPEGVEQLCMRSPRLKVLRLDDCIRLTDATLTLVARSLPELNSFSLKGGPFTSITFAGLRQLSKMPSLTDLHLDRNGLVDDNLLNIVVEGCPHLRVLTLAQAGTDEKLTKNGLGSLVACTGLRELDLSYLAACQDQPLLALAAANTELEVLRLRGCVRLTDAGVGALADNVKRLQELDISGCVAVSNRSIERFLKRSGDNKSLLTVAVGGTSCDASKLSQKAAASRVVIDPTDFSKAYLSGGPKQLDAGGAMDRLDDDDLSDDEFESLTAQRSFVIDALEEDDDLLEEEAD